MSYPKLTRKQLVYAICLILGLGSQWAFPSLLNAAEQLEHKHQDVQGQYYCPMHPEVTSDKPGRCPKCNMFLVKQDAAKPENADIHKAHQADKGDLYYCPMHPDITSDKPGRCPECNMFLVKQEIADPKTANNESSTQTTKNTTTPQIKALTPASENDAGGIKFICPMHPQIISDVPGSCPICGMNLEKVTTGNKSSIEINVSGEMQQALALRVAKAQKETLAKQVKTVGEVSYDESQITHIHARVSGWIEKLNIDAVGDNVEKGQLLYEIYSPDLINAQDDYLLALNTLEQSGNKARYSELIRKAGLRLELLGMNKTQIQQLKKSKKTQYRVPFYAQESGVVNALLIREGMYIEPQTEVLSLVDLSNVWVIADVFENEQSWLKIGQTANVTIPAMGISGIQGNIDYIYPELDPVTRSLRVRVIIDNKNINLRPNSLANISFVGDPRPEALVIPQEALIQTGQANRVIIKLSDNSFATRNVTVGMMTQGKAEILTGINEGDNVVISGQFLLDSEASLKGSLLRLTANHQH